MVCRAWILSLLQLLAFSWMGRQGSAAPSGCDPAILGTVVCNSSLPAEFRAAALVKLLTTEEKIEQTNTFSFETQNFSGFTPSVARLGLPAYNITRKGYTAFVPRVRPAPWPRPCFHR